MTYLQRVPKKEAVLKIRVEIVPKRTGRIIDRIFYKIIEVPGDMMITKAEVSWEESYE